MLRETPVTKPSDMVSLFRADLAKIA